MKKLVNRFETTFQTLVLPADAVNFFQKAIHEQNLPFQGIIAKDYITARVQTLVINTLTFS